MGTGQGQSLKLKEPEKSCIVSSLTVDQTGVERRAAGYLPVQYRDWLIRGESTVGCNVLSKHLLSMDEASDVMPSELPIEHRQRHTRDRTTSLNSLSHFKSGPSKHIRPSTLRNRGSNASMKSIGYLSSLQV
jgi:hypothetical protein